jgi:hypothetical protein
MRLPLALLAAAAVVGHQARAGAQGVVTPTSHWGGIMLPDFAERSELGLHVVSFTQFGKEVRPGTEQYTFAPYNGFGETLGFNS